MNIHHVQYLKCPICSGPSADLQITCDSNPSGDSIKNGALSCSNGHRYPIRDYVVDFVLAEDSTAKNSHIYDALWDSQQPQDYKGRRDEYIRKFQISAMLPGDLEDYFRDKVVFDAGCGEGRFTYLASDLGAKAVIALDYSLKVLHCARFQTNAPWNVTFVRANLECPPLKEVFDYGFSMGVLHHTPSTKKSFNQVVKLIKPEGYFSLYVYCKWSLPRIYWLLRPITCRLPKNWIINLCNWFGWGYNPDIKPLVPLKLWFRKLGKMDFLGLGQMTSEGLTTPYIWEHSREEVEGWFLGAGFELISSTGEVAASGKRKSQF